MVAWVGLTDCLVTVILATPAAPATCVIVTASKAGTEDALARVVAAELASVHRVLYAEASRRSLAGESREEIQAVLAATAERAFDLLEPSLGSYGVREAG